jgi:type II secretory pathway component GspD/PulD (secretin)
LSPDFAEFRYNVFCSTDRNVEKSELVILLTPRIITGDIPHDASMEQELTVE